LNREGKEQRSVEVTKVENTIKDYLAELMPVDLEIEFQAPTVDVLLTTPKIVIHDGFRGSIEGKGHGLQRAVIFAILRSYARLVTQVKGKERKTLILGVEEPEIYMHPTAQRATRTVLRSIADGGDQVLFSTHSPLC
jgi:predicted ATP-dependent endonuclease of OLD family